MGKPIPDPTAPESSAIDSETGELLYGIRYVSVKDFRAPTAAELEGGTFLGFGKFEHVGEAVECEHPSYTRRMCDAFGRCDQCGERVYP